MRWCKSYRHIGKLSWLIEFKAVVSNGIGIARLRKTLRYCQAAWLHEMFLFDRCFRALATSDFRRTRFLFSLVVDCASA